LTSSSGGSGPSVNFAFDDTNDNLQYDPGEEKYTCECSFTDFNNASVNLVIPSSFSGGTLNPSGGIDIEAANITSQVDMDGGSSNLRLNVDSGRTINLTGDISTNKQIRLQDAQDVVLTGDISADDQIRIQDAQDVVLRGSMTASNSQIRVPTDATLDFDGATLTGSQFQPDVGPISARNGDWNFDKIQFKGLSGDLDLRGATVEATNQLQFNTQIQGDLYINDSSQQAVMDTKKVPCAEFDSTSRTIYVNGVEITNNKDEFNYKPSGATQDGSPDSGTIGTC
jgi:hypothetical protein